MKKITVILITLLLGFCLEISPSWAQSLSLSGAYSTLSYMPAGANGNSLVYLQTGGIYLAWTANPPNIDGSPSGISNRPGYWEFFSGYYLINGKFTPGTGGLTLYYAGSTGHILFLPSNESPGAVTQQEFTSIAGTYQFCMTYNEPLSNGTSQPDHVCSNVIMITGYPSDTPIGTPGTTSPVFGPYFSNPLLALNKQALTPDPINIATGEDYFSSTDISLSGVGPSLKLSRKYRSFSNINGILGYGWRTDFDTNLSQDSYGNVTIYDGDGTAIYFINTPPTQIIGGELYAPSYTPSPGNFSTLVKNSDNSFTLTDKHGIVTHYSANGRLLTRTDSNGNTLSFVYNPVQAGGTYIQDVGGRRITLNFGTNGHVISAIDPAGKTFQYGYDPNGNLVGITDPTGAVTNYTYDSNHKIIQFTNSNTHNRYYQYDSQGRATGTWQDNNVNKTILNYQTNNTTVVTDSLGNNSTYAFNDSYGYGLLTSYTDPLGNVTQQAWDLNMDKISVIDARNNTTNFAYDGNGNIVQVTDPLGNSTSMSYTPNFNLISSKTDALGDTTTFSYDAHGNLKGITDALGDTHSFVYDQYGDLITTTDSRGNSTNFIYDALGHLLQKTDALGQKIILTYE